MIVPVLTVREMSKVNLRNRSKWKFSNTNLNNILVLLSIYISEDVLLIEHDKYDKIVF